MLDLFLASIGLPVASCCNGHVFFLGCLVFALACAASSGRWSSLRLVAAAFIGLAGNIVRILVIIPLARLPHFTAIHDVFGWLLSGVSFLFVWELYNPSVFGARLIGFLTLFVMFVWTVLFVLASA